MSVLAGTPTEAADSRLFGDQTPRILVAPSTKFSAAAEAIELAASFGLDLDPWQQLVLEHALAENDDGTWAAFTVGLTVPRQCGKNVVIEARELASLFLFQDDLILHSAHELSTAKESMRRMEGLIVGSGMASNLRVVRGHGEECIEVDGRRILYRTRTKAGGRGFSASLCVFDESQNLTSESVQAILPTLSAQPNPQVWFVGSAVDQTVHAHGHAFASVRRRALDGDDPRLCYMEWSATEDDDVADPRTWAKTNPAMGYRISRAHIEAEYRALKHTPKVFAVERLGVGDWPELGVAEQPVLPAEVWDGLVIGEEAPRLVGPVALAVDRSPDRSMWSIAAARRTLDGRVHLEIGFHRSAPNAEIVETIVNLVTVFDPVALVIDQKSAAAVIKPYLVEAQIEPVVTNASELALGCGAFLDAALDRRLCHTGQRVLGDAVASAVKRDLPGGGFAWRATPGGSITTLMAATLALFGLVTFGAPPRKVAAPVFGGVKERLGEDDVDRALGRGLDILRVPF